MNSKPEVLIPYNRITFGTAGSIIYPPGGTFGPRTQLDVQLVLLHTGSMKVTIDGISHAVKPGHAVILLPGHLEYFNFATDQETWHRWISVHLEGLAIEDRDWLDELPFCVPITEELNRLTDLMLALRSEHEMTSAMMRSMGHAALQLFMSMRNSTKHIDAHPSIRRAKEFIHDRFAEEIALVGLAAHAGVSPEHLVRLFRQYEGTTPIKYVWHYRVLRAVELLSHTGLSITEIAYRCGFKTSFHFARLVKQQTGLPPSEIRKQSWSPQ